MGSRGRLTVLVWSLAGALWLGAPAAHAAPADPCYLMIPGAIKDACENTQKMVTAGGGGSGPGDLITDPLGTIARSCGQGASWLLGQLSTVLDGPTTRVDFTNLGFLKTYATVFAASSVLVVLIWLYAVIKRVINGVGPVTALTEAVGYLWMAVIASAFTPVALAGVVTITDAITDAIASTAPGARVPGPGGTWTTASGPGSYFSTLTSTLAGGPTPDLGGSIVFIFISVLTLVIAGFLWLELLMRVAMLYIGGVLAPAVYAGLVDRELWRHVWRWVSLMAGIDVAKPILVVVLILGQSVAVNGAPAVGLSSVISGLAIMWLAAFGTAAVYRIVPVVGDDLSWGKSLRGRGATPIVQLQQAARIVQQGMATHADRPAGPVPAGIGGAGQDRIRPEMPAPPATQSWGSNSARDIAARPQGPMPPRRDADRPSGGPS